MLAAENIRIDEATTILMITKMDSLDQ